MSIEFLIWPILLSTVTVVLLCSHLLKKKRREELKLLFYGLGYQYEEDSLQPASLPINSLDLFNRGRNRKLENVARLDLGERKLMYADYFYKTGTGKNSKYHRLSVLCLYGAVDIPNFSLSREDFFSKIAQVAGYKDIDFESDPEFSKMFVLRGKDIERIKAVFTPQIVNNLKRYPNARIESAEGMIVFYQQSLVAANELKSWIEQSRRVLESFVE